MTTPDPQPFIGLIDLAAESLGGRALATSDDFFASKENLIKPGRGIFLPEKYTEHGKWMDGWESRRRRGDGDHDWCVIQLGAPGVIRGVDIDTNHFLGNHPPYAALEAASIAGTPEAAAVAAYGKWTTILPTVPLRAGAQNLCLAAATTTPASGWTHVRLKIFPDGGVARLRVYGEVLPHWPEDPKAVVDLAAVGNGAQALACSDMFFSPMNNLLMPGRGRDMGDGWETRRKRSPGHDWVIVRLGAAGTIQQLEIDTAHFKGNAPARCSLEGGNFLSLPLEQLVQASTAWQPVLPETALQADHLHTFAKELQSHPACTHVRLNIFPDGGVSRLRAWGQRRSA